MKKIFCLTLFLLIGVSIPLMATAQVVSIPDPSLRAKVEKALGKTSGATITVAEMAKLTNLKATNARISDLTGIGVATNLTSLDLSRNRITDISPLAGLTGLKNLNLMKNRIADISPLAGLTNLKTLNLRNNSITDISPLVTNTGLGRRDTVELRGNPLGPESFNTHLPALISRAVKVHFHINIPDPNLRAAFEKALGKKRGAPISAVNMAKLTSLKVKSAQISDLTGIGYATKLTYLDLGTNSITDISPLTKLTKLTTLFLSYNSITDISPLAELTKLTSLNLAFNDITDISSLAGLTKLTSLSLGDNSITDISPLANLTKLTSLKLFINQITDISPLTKLKKLTYLDFFINNITDISPLTKLKQLTTLDLQYNSITDISPLVANTGVGSGDVVRLSQNPLSPESIDTHIPALRARSVNVNWTQSPGAPSIVLAGMSPALALKGSIVWEVSGVNLGNFRVTVKNLSNDHATMTVAADGQGYQLKVEAGSAGNIFVISAQSPDPKVAVQPLRYTITAADVLRGWIQLPALVAYEIPTETVLLANYPNPFNPETWIPYRLAEDAFVTLTIYDRGGRVVRTLEIGHRIAAVYESRSKAIYWDGRNQVGETVASGVYFYHLKAGDYSQTRKMLILK